MNGRNKRFWWQATIANLQDIDRLWVFRFTKRQRFIFATILASLGVLATQLVPDTWRFVAIVILGIFTYLASAWALREDLAGVEYFTLLFLPTAFTIGWAMAYFLLPVRWLTRIPMTVLFAVCFYGVLLTENIFNVAAIRTIQLLRAAHTVGYFFTLLVAFLFFEVLFAFHLPALLIALIVTLLMFPLTLSYLWSLKLSPELEVKYFLYSAVMSLGIGEISWAISFWPLAANVASLFLVACLYAFLGILQHYFQFRLNRRTAVEYVLVGVAVFLIMVLTTRWGS